ncbi:putative membrane protein, partial [Vibrio parahaemolyticus AQ3810]
MSKQLSVAMVAMVGVMLSLGVFSAEAMADPK